MKLFILAFLSLISSAFANFIEITKPGVYDFKGEIIEMAPNTNSPAIVIGDSKTQEPSFRVYGITLKNVTIIGNEHQQTSEYHAPLPFLRNNGITIRGASNVIVENVTVIGARSGGIVLEKGCENIVVRNSAFIANHFDGVAACETKNSLFYNLVVAHNRYAGISLDWWVYNCKFRDILSIFNRDWTIFLRASQKISLDNVWSLYNGGGYFASINSDIPYKNEASIKIENSIFYDRRGSFIGEKCYLYY
jgi:parallel beta helix pectate lyase-like protein